jgi:hypothetical protein
VFVWCVRSRSPRPTSQPAPAGLAFGPPASAGVGVAVGAGQAHADALGFAGGVGRPVIFGIAVTDAGAFAYAVAVTFGSPGAGAVCLALRPGNVAKVGPDSPANRGHGPAIQLPCGG